MQKKVSQKQQKKDGTLTTVVDENTITVPDEDESFRQTVFNPEPSKMLSRNLQTQQSGQFETQTS